MDLTKYIEEHNFNFDNVFDFHSDNHEVSSQGRLPSVYTHYFAHSSKLTITLTYSAKL